MLAGAAALALAVWLLVLALPSQGHRIRERFEPDDRHAAGADLSDIAVLIPARNEAETITATLAALVRQGRDLEIVVVDDESHDATAELCRRAAEAAPQARIAVLPGQPVPAGWGGKLWALQQGIATIDRRWVLLLDADIEIDAGVVAGLRELAERHSAALVTIMATLRCLTFWERLLAPPFVYFFKLLYPFRRVNDPASRCAAAAGGCILVRRDALAAAGAFGAFRDALIDDCTLAARVKQRGGRLWIGMSRAVRSRRAYGLASFWHMVARTAFTQLRYSALLLALVLALMGVMFIAPLAAIAMAGTPGTAAGFAAWLAMSVSFAPVVRFYRLPLAWCLTLPFAALAFMAMSTHSAVRYWRGTRATWKERHYEA